MELPPPPHMLGDVTKSSEINSKLKLLIRSFIMALFWFGSEDRKMTI